MEHFARGVWNRTEPRGRDQPPAGTASRNATFRMGNSTFGVDPDPGRIKTLRIYARDRNGRRRMFEYRESSTVDGSMFAGWHNGNWGRDPWNGRWNDDDYR